MRHIFFAIILMFSILILVADGVEPVGSGSETDPYQIQNLDNLLWLSTTPDFWTSYFIQTENIDASDTENWNEGEGFSPIGNAENPFMGSYNGQSHEVEGLFINRPSEDSMGFFGVIGERMCDTTATIINLGVMNSNVVGNNLVGAIAGYTLNNTVVDNCYSSGYVAGYSDVGGFIGCNEDDSSITNSYTSCEVTGDRYTAGFIGINSDALIRNCYSTGFASGNVVICGFVAENEYAYIDSCYCLGDVTGESCVCGMIGSNYDSIIEHSYCTGDIESDSGASGFVGSNSYGSEIKNCYSHSIINTNSNAQGFGGTEDDSFIINCYSKGRINCYDNANGFAGVDSDPNNILNSFWDYEASGKYNSVGGATRKTTAEMTQISTFTDTDTEGLTQAWDFVGNPNDDTQNEDIWVWNYTNNLGYPGFSWLAEPEYANFTANVVINPNSVVATFADHSTCNPISWEWDFNNDGTIDSYEQNPVHTYTTEGIYSVVLTVNDGENEYTITKEDYIEAWFVGSEEEEINIANLNLRAYPNPFNPETTISFNLAEQTEVELNIYNSIGQIVKNLVKGNLNSGNHSTIWNGVDNQGNSVGSGIYFYKLKSKDVNKTKRIVLLK